MRENEPFKTPLEDSEYSHKIKLLEAAPDKVVRKYLLYSPRLIKLSEKITSDEWASRRFHEEFEKEIDKFKRGSDIFRTLEKKYHIAIPKFDCVVGKNEEDADVLVYIVVDKIIGENIEEASNLPPEAREKLDEFYTALIQYYYDVFQEGGDYWWDFTNKQIVYGHKKDEKEDKVYIVDIEPFYLTLKRNKEDLVGYLNRELSLIISSS